MESGAISDMQIRGSSEHDGNHSAVQARLNYNVPGKFGGWSARTNDKNQWLQVDLLSHFTKVTRVATQGRRDIDQWVTKYNLKYSKNGLNFLYYRESRKRNDKVFAGNTDRNTVVSHDLNPPITARFYRFLPLHWFVHISMRVELYGCHECLSALGMESAEISEKQISASSEYSSQLVASQSRLNIQPRAGKLGSWAAATNNVHQWLQVDLGVYSIVTRVATQGRHDAQQWVTKYKLMYGHHPSRFFFHRLFGNFFFQEFIGNINKDTVVLHDLSPPITARYVRFLPLEWISHISMRVELYGCHGK
ncbi:EGF-like repeat and discoidin I-like domain-containing protein 3 [Pocillopora damicornis]|uniref:EGF-like repeat and discoidin I-like domain-containing protein 3 n=1 Tax=Pocillopora damicornis TaxID=46731 RepID=UPI000F556B34|nr:EGF-like repeat and discoidin I-like domain-containing protein 3 [Pocillopora damicornis]